MRFTFLLPSDNLTGGTRVVAVYAAELVKLGHEVLIITCAPDEPGWRTRLRDRLRAPFSATTYSIPAPGHVAMSGVPHKIMSRPGPIGTEDVPDADVIVATWWETAVWMAAMPDHKGRKVHLIQGYEVWFGDDYLPRVHAALRLPNLKIAISRDLKETIERAVGVMNICVIPNAVDPKQFDAPPRSRSAVPTVGFVYATARIKGADICTTACEIARQTLPRLNVIAFGADTPTAGVPLPADCRFTHRPPQDQLRTQYAACDAWLFGSRLDSFGLPILEAMSCRTPVIAVPIGAAVDLIAGGGGEIVASESPEAMADAIVRICAGPTEVWQRMSDLAYATAHGYSWRDATERLLILLQQFAPQPRSGT